ncbi:MAG: NifU family protein [Rickettsiales bacterium]|jgi:Fe-S cluster biogenesis protein NfuA|nr:NifU family protein [Rickettsiales bacterium]MDA9573859.1 NifU family protein [Rickettsiales bacterium]|tara:strand:- start:7635 stop:8198 length:564 start_codon:yes stop_codon:yes gene_type:complete
MFIQCEETPNPETLKFIPDGQIVAGDRICEFLNQKQASNISPLAMQLFTIDGIKSLFFGRDFITITKKKDYDWEYIKSHINANILDFYISGKEIFFHKIDNNEQSSEEDSDIIKQIKELIEIKVRPAVAMDGGDITFHSFDDGIVRLQLKGACQGCPSSSITLKNGIENMLKHYIPEVEAVEQILED